MNSILSDGLTTPSAADLQLDALTEDVKALFVAVTDGDLKKVQELLPKDSIVKEAKALTEKDDSTAATVAAPASPSDPAASSSSIAGISVNVSDGAGFTPLMIACRFGHSPIVSYLLTHPHIDVNARSHNGNTALMYACLRAGSIQTLKALLEAGANYFSSNMNQDTILMCAALSGDLEMFSYILSGYHALRAQQSKGSALIKLGAALKKWITHTKNEEGLTVLMCAAMGGNAQIVRQVIAEARAEFGVVLPPAMAKPSARSMFFPTIWPSALGELDIKAASAAAASSSKSSKSKSSTPAPLIDPSPPAFLAYIDSANFMGDTALHILAQNQSVALYLELLDSTGADPMIRNRRGKMSFELIEKKGSEDGKMKIEEITDEEMEKMKQQAADSSSSASAAASSSSTSAASPTSDDVARLLSQILTYQRQVRDEYRAKQREYAEKQFAELMLEEESSTAMKKGGAAAEKKKAKKKKKSSASTAELKSSEATNDDNEASSDTEATQAAKSTSDASPTKSTAAPSSTTTSTSAAAPALSPLAPPFVPLAEIAKLDAANGWETVAKQPKQAKKKGGDAAAATVAAGTVQLPTTTPTPAAANKSKKLDQQPKSKSTKSAKIDTAVGASSSVATKSEAMKKSATNKQVKATAALPTTTAVAASVPPKTATTAVGSKSSKPSKDPMTSSTLSPYAFSPQAIPPFNTSLNSNSTSSPLTSSLPRSAQWRPTITILGTEQALPSSSSSSMNAVAASSSISNHQQPYPPSPPSAPTADSLQQQFSSLHTQIESTDLQITNFLGSGWESLSLSQLSVLDEVYSSLSRQIREAQFAIFQKQQQETMNEMQRMKIELAAMRRK